MCVCERERESEREGERDGCSKWMRVCGGGGGDHEEQHLTEEKSDKTNFPTGFLPWEQNRGGGRGVRAKIKK